MIMEGDTVNYTKLVMTDFYMLCRMFQKYDINRETWS